MTTITDPTAEQARDIAATDLHRTLERTVLAAFERTPGAAAVLAATAEHALGITVNIQGAGSWRALQGGKPIAEGKLDPEQNHEIAEAAAHAITSALNTEPADRRKAIWPLLASAPPVIGLTITGRTRSLVLGLLGRDGRVVWSAACTVEHEADAQADRLH